MSIRSAASHSRAELTTLESDTTHHLWAVPGAAGGVAIDVGRRRGARVRELRVDCGMRDHCRSWSFGPWAAAWIVSVGCVPSLTSPSDTLHDTGSADSGEGDTGAVDSGEDDTDTATDTACATWDSASGEEAPWLAPEIVGWLYVEGQPGDENERNLGFAYAPLPDGSFVVSDTWWNEGDAVYCWSGPIELEENIRDRAWTLSGFGAGFGSALTAWGDGIAVQGGEHDVYRFDVGDPSPVLVGDGNVYRYPSRFGADDFTGDGLDDLAMVVEPDGGTDTRLVVIDGALTGGVTLGDEPAALLVAGAREGFWASEPNVGDLDGDGMADLAMGTEETTWIARGPLAEVRSVEDADVTVAGYVQAIGDFTGDGLSDVLAHAHDDDPPLAVLSPTEDRAYALSDGLATFATESPWDSVALDVDGDGVSDLALGNSVSNRIWLVFGPAAGTLGFQEGSYCQLHITADPTSVRPADLDADGLADLVFTLEYRQEFTSEWGGVGALPDATILDHAISRGLR